MECAFRLRALGTAGYLGGWRWNGDPPKISAEIPCAGPRSPRFKRTGVVKWLDNFEGFHTGASKIEVALGFMLGDEFEACSKRGMADDKRNDSDSLGWNYSST
jgi:hypothetical protein